MARKGRKGRSGGRKTRTITKYASRAKGYAKKGGGILAGAIAGAAPQVAAKFGLNLGQWTQPVADIATGMYMKNDTLQTIGGRAIGAMLASGLNTGTGTGTTGAYSMLG